MEGLLLSLPFVSITVPFNNNKKEVEKIKWVERDSKSIKLRLLTQNKCINQDEVQARWEVEGEYLFVCLVHIQNLEALRKDPVSGGN